MNEEILYGFVFEEVNWGMCSEKVSNKFMKETFVLSTCLVTFNGS